jgi:hypothetical protein
MYNSTSYRSNNANIRKYDKDAKPIHDAYVYVAVLINIVIIT